MGREKENRRTLADLKKPMGQENKNRRTLADLEPESPPVKEESLNNSFGNHGGTQGSMSSPPSTPSEENRRTLADLELDSTPVKEEELDPEARALLGKKRHEFTQMFLSIYERTKNGRLKQKLPCPRTIMLDSNRRPRDEDMIVNHVSGAT